LFGADIRYHGIGSDVSQGAAAALLEDMTPHSQEDRVTRWFVYLAGTAVFMAIFYFCLRRFLDASQEFQRRSLRKLEAGVKLVKSVAGR
jgi:hypothetical protein